MSKQLMIGDDSVTLQKVSSQQMNSYTPEQGTLIYNTTTNTIFVYTGLIWRELMMCTSHNAKDDSHLMNSIHDLCDELDKLKKHLKIE